MNGEASTYSVVPRASSGDGVVVVGVGKQTGGGYGGVLRGGGSCVGVGGLCGGGGGGGGGAYLGAYVCPPLLHLRRRHQPGVAPNECGAKALGRGYSRPSFGVLLDQPSRDVVHRT